MVDNKGSAQKLVKWYEGQKRPLPWRVNRDPYPIWISEIMLQQTTTKAVIGFFDRFLKRFPTVKSLAKASIEDVYEQWAGLGYYSRARNIHKAAQIIAANGFPNNYKELLDLPGFGPYTARAVSSQAFGEKAGVVDGNVIRVYCRIFNFNQEWWTTAVQSKIQQWSDSLVQHENPSDMNQALMELGATICTPKSPSCLLCPWSQTCQSFKMQTQSLVPIQKPKKKTEIWIWSPLIYKNKKDEILLVENNDVSFLKKKWVFPGEAVKVTTKPKSFSYKHSITHHEIYVNVELTTKNPLGVEKAKVVKKKTLASTAKKKGAIPPENETFIYVKTKELSQKSPFSLVKKALDFI